MKKALLAAIAALVFALPISAQEIGVQSHFGEEDEVIDPDNLRVVVAYEALDLPGFKSGAAVELGYNDGVNAVVWNQNRREVGKGVVAGVDLKVYEDGKGFEYDERVVAGYKFSEKITGYVYLLEDNRPVAFGATYSW